MDPARFLVRRANIDDLEGLKELWMRSGLQVLEMERHLTEFQLVSSTEGDLEGVVALRVQGKHGLLHSEAFTHPEREDEFRELLWGRLKTLAHNHGLARIWTQEKGPYWHQVAGFEIVGPEQIQKLPPSFGDPSRSWSSALLRHDEDEGLSLEREFELFRQASQANMTDVIGKTQTLRNVAYIVTALFFLVVFGLGLYVTFRWMRDSSAAPRNRR